MPIAEGQQLGPYQVLSALGAGGMGEVYKARDTRLDRTVAIKVLPAHLAENPDLRARLEREARALSSLSHPHICALYDIGQQDGVDFIVMEHLEGETLATRLERGPVPVGEALRIGMEVAEALDKAHRQGVIHRDLKPGNIMLTKSGAKLVDFGLARADGVAGDGTASETAMPTMNQPLTAQGTILGTFQYMAPEQLEGREADARTDIFALGAVLHEMATGQKAFVGGTQASLVAAVMHAHPPAVSTLQPLTPPGLDQVVKTCLAKDPEARWQTAHDVALQLKWLAEGGSLAGIPAPVSARRKTRERLAWALFAAASLAALALGVGFVLRAPEPGRLVRFQIPADASLTVVGSPRLSPDGRLMAFNATDTGGTTQIWVRPLDALEARPVSGTEGAGRPFWSPDGRYLGFFSGGKLKKVDAAGGPAQTLCDAPNGADASWSSEGVILFDGRTTDPLMRVPAAGGVARPEVDLDKEKGRTGAGWPEFLPDGRHFLYVGQFRGGSNAPGEPTLFVRALDTGEERELLKTASRVQYAAPGYLLYVREDSLVAQPFDAKARKLTGEAVPVAEGLGTDAVGLAHFSASVDGTLAYRAGDTRSRQLLWVDRQGKEIESVGPSGEYGDVWPSPDGKRLVFDMPESGSGNNDLWIRDLARGVTSRFTFDPADDNTPLWSPDGRTIVFTSDRKGPGDLFRKDASGTGEEEPLLVTDEQKFACDWSRDGRFLVFMSRGAETGWDVWALPMEGDGKPLPLVKTRFREMLPVLAPNGRYVAYVSNESGRNEVYVQEFPEPRSKWQVSTAGGTDPHWRSDGKEIFYRAPDSKLMSVSTDTSSTFTAGAPVALFQARLQPAILRSHYRPSPDGQRFLTLAPLGRNAILPTTVVLNWTEGLRD
jgi:Tol biopolymer transport system component/predicted Ser/Thr protein kinase